MFEILLRLVFSLAAVVGLMLLIARAAGKRFKGRPGAIVSVVHRQQISRHASVAVVTVGSRVLVLGATEQQVQMLAELDPLDLVAAEEVGLAEVDGPADTAGYADEPVDLAVLGLHDRRGAAGRTRSFAQILRAETEQPEGGAHRAERPVSMVPRTGSAPADGPLAGSLLSPTTWRRAIDAVTGRAS
ncbi:FliO/MopB family protein [Nocardioides pantholopis]|uniref:FliO/MopB family protein n=1 Tax=Nocardioides pantholopis TaxID=2483798 RepID=UPI000FD85BB2|nr:flagellar biosynthetic protein FliO [Nocardioides pantholopis]